MIILQSHQAISPLPPLCPSCPLQVLVRVVKAGVCHSDLHIVDGDFPIKPVRAGPGGQAGMGGGCARFISPPPCSKLRVALPPVFPCAL